MKLTAEILLKTLTYYVGPHHWHVGQREEPVQPLGRVLHVDPKAILNIKKYFHLYS